MATTIQYSERVGGAEARTAATAGGAGARGAARARARRPHEGRRRPAGLHTARSAPRTKARHQDHITNSILQLQGH